eukprot:404577-Lingulodinium_polyedra.AAC.1
MCQLFHLAERLEILPLARVLRVRLRARTAGVGVDTVRSQGSAMVDTMRYLIFHQFVPSIRHDKAFV